MDKHVNEVNKPLFGCVFTNHYDDLTAEAAGGHTEYQPGFDKHVALRRCMLPAGDTSRLFIAHSKRVTI